MIQDGPILTTTPTNHLMPDGWDDSAQSWVSADAGGGGGNELIRFRGAINSRRYAGWSMGALVLIMPFLVGFLLVFAALTVRLRQAGMSVHITRAVLSIVCGLQFPLAVLLDSVSKIGKHIPLTHFVNMIRGIIIHKQPLFTYKNSIIYIIVTGILMLMVGVFVFELTKRNVKSRGLVAGY